MREHADVAAVDDRHAGIERGFEAGALPRDARRLGLLSLLPTGVLARRIAGRERGTEGDLLLDHQLEDLGRPAIAMLDGIHPRRDRGPHAIDAAGMRRDRRAADMRGLHPDGERLDRERLMGAGERPPAIVGVELDPVGAFPDLAADDACHRVDAVGLFGALRDVPFGRIALRAVAPGGDDGAGRHQHARTGNDALIDRLLQADIGVPGAFRAQIANGREARQQRVAQVVHRARRPERQRLVRHLIVPGGFVVRMEQDVRVTFDQARRQRRAGQIDDARAGGGRAGVSAGRVDPVAFDPHRPPLVHRLAVEDARRLHDRHCRRRRALGRRQRHSEADADDEHGCLSHAPILNAQRSTFNSQPLTTSLISDRDCAS